MEKIVELTIHMQYTADLLHDELHPSVQGRSVFVNLVPIISLKSGLQKHRHLQTLVEDDP